MPRRGRVLVVGAGLSGLAAAWTLSGRGFATLVCERSARPGGRVSSRRDQGFSIDLAWPVLSSGDRDLLAWIGAVGLASELLPLRPVVGAQLHRGRLREVAARGWLGAARTPGIRPHEALRLRRLPRLLGRYAAHLEPAEPGRAAPLDDRSLGDFGRLYFGPTVLERWMTRQLAAHSAADPDEASRALFLRRYRSQGDAAPGLPRAPLGELPEAAARRLEVRYQTEVARVEPAPGGSLRATLVRDGRERRLEVEAAVVASAAPEAARVTRPLLVAAERDFFDGVRYAPSAVLAVGLRRALHPHPLQISVPRDEGSPLDVALAEPGVSGGRVPAGRGLALLRAAAGWAARSAAAPDEAVAKELLAAFGELEPGARGAVLFSRLLRPPRGHPRFDVGHYRALARFAAVQVELRGSGRRLYFAGDYLMDPTWNGAVGSGLRAAEALAQDLPADAAG